MNRIYLKLEEPPKNLRELMDKLYSYTTDYSVRAIETYSDPECTLKQCTKERNRSFDDLIIIARTYFPDTTEIELTETLMSLGKKTLRGKECFPVPFNCCTIDKPVIYYYPDIDASDLDFEEDEIPENSMYCWSELLAKLDIFSLDDVVKYNKENKKKLLELEEC